MRAQRTKSVSDKVNFDGLRKLTDITVQKLMDDNYKVFARAFFSVLAKTIGMNGNPLYYVMRGVTGDYDYPWMTREDNLKNCLLRIGEFYKNDNITFYLLFFQYIGTRVVGSNITNKYHPSKNGHKCHQDLELHFWYDAYLTNKETFATSTMKSAVYNSDCGNFTLEN